MSRSSVIYNTSLSKAVQDLLSKMENAGYSEGSQTSVFITLRPIQTFMETEGFAEYSPEVGNSYLDAYIQEHNPKKRQRQRLTRCIEMLNLSFEGALINRKKTGYIYNESLSVLIHGLIEQLRGMGYSENTMHNYMVRLRPIQSYMRKNGIAEYSAEVGDAYYEHFLKTHKVCAVQKRALKAVISRLNDFSNGTDFIKIHSYYEADQIPTSFTDVVDDFFRSGEITGTSESTIHRRTKSLAIFLTKCIHCSVNSVKDFTPQLIQMACSNVSDDNDWIAIRQFLRYLVRSGKTENDLSTFVPKNIREIKVPSTYSVEEIQSLEAAPDRSTFSGRRDYLIILFASRLTIRAGDIAKMKVDNLDFDNERISFTQQKTGVEIALPMIPELRDALQNHLAEANVSDGFIFHSTMAPNSPITRGTVTGVISKYFRRAGINISGKKHGPHALRASASTSMINDDIPYEAVRSILGHTSSNAIKHYAKADIDKLRRCAISVSEPSGNFAEFLKGGAAL